MNDDWWPDLLAYIPKEDPWSETNVVVAELRSYEDPWLPGTRSLWSALVPLAELEALDGQLIAFNYEVESTGRPGPGFKPAGTLSPRFYISGYHKGRHFECEPLVLEWESHNQNAMMLDPRFAMTYGLIPRAHSDGSTRWDNPAEPEFDVAVTGAPSIYNDGRHSGARTVVSRDYLQDYLTLRGMALVQVYYENRSGERDGAIDALLGDQDRIIEKLSAREVDVRRRAEGGFFAQVWGARVIGMPGDMPVTENPLEHTGLSWPGHDGPITQRAASRMRPWDYVFVRDAVLADYEGRPGFRVNAESGSVSHGNQWSVGPADRVGRDVIRLEIKKLYEGTPPRVVKHWNSFAIAPSAELLAPEGRMVRNIGLRAKELVYGIADIGRSLCGIAAMFGIEPRGTADYVGIDRVWLDPNGWWNAPYAEPISRHIPADMSRSEFLGRCLDLDKLLNEPLAQKRLRPLMHAFGPPHGNTQDFRGLKLLDRIICLCQVAVDAGLKPWEVGDEIAKRYAADGTAPEHPLSKLFALSDLRQAAGHRKEDLDAAIASALRRFDVNISATQGGWGLILDMIYDQLSEQLAQILETLTAVMRIGARS